ncbi:putative protein kinase RLK-Pelle-DLSV family [Helianthus annuus]|nr:putative protein kinase RLK-Pelle-DLSV family [Helianthus annuus]
MGIESYSTRNISNQRTRRGPLQFTGTPEHEREHDPENKSDDEDLKLPLLGLSTLVTTTNNFSVDNKLGEGGFGPVYKGVLEDGQEIAVKRLTQTSTQGLQEFKNEVISISKLQHRNLVKLLGCCIERGEKMLIYEYMLNKGLDSFILSKLLDWPTRYHIIIGISRGLLYLNQDSRLRIIHRDLKVSNILLDTNMNPKISDFGKARSFGGNQIEENTNRVVGTYFGVLVLEIVCGEKNRRFTHKEHGNNLIGHVLRSIHVGLLCVQRHPEDRPTITSVIHMLGSEGPLPSPKEPGFYVGESPQGFYEGSYEVSSTNELSITTLNVDKIKVACIKKITSSYKLINHFVCIIITQYGVRKC